MNPRAASARAWLASLLVSLTALVVYRATLAPGLSWANAGTDGGDLVTAAAVWGVPHPPGYPTYTLLGHLFTGLPFGSVAFNLNLMSAACAALAAMLVAASALHGSSRRPGVHLAALVAGLTAAFGSMLWGQATIAEVHALNALFVAAIGFITRPWADALRALRPPGKVVLGLLFGAGLGNSTTLIALAPIVLPALWREARGRRAGFLALVAGLSVYGLIPARASTLPPINWGDARSVPNFIALVSGELYRGYAFAAPGDLIVQRLLGLPRQWLEQIGWVGAIWIGWDVANRVERKRLLPVLLSMALYVFFAVEYNTVDSDLYLIPVWVLSAGWLGAGLRQMLIAQAGRARPIGIGLLAGVGITLLLIGNWATRDLSRDRAASDFAEGVLRRLPPDAVLITHADAHTFSLWYYRLVEGRRPDVSIVDARLAGYPWYDLMLVAQGAAPRLPGERRESGLTERLAALNPDRPVCFVDSDRGSLECPTP